MYEEGKEEGKASKLTNHIIAGKLEVARTRAPSRRLEDLLEYSADLSQTLDIRTTFLNNERVTCAQHLRFIFAI